LEFGSTLGGPESSKSELQIRWKLFEKFTDWNIHGIYILDREEGEDRPLKIHLLANAFAHVN
jgi:hypothetical protein